MALKRIGVVVLLGLLDAGGAAGATTCPMSVETDSTRHLLERASVSYGPPGRLEDLTMVGDRWTGLRDMDPYLTCHYDPTPGLVALSVTFHLRGVSMCQRFDHPYRVVCR